jgi:ribosomal protein S12 methylthiotransferase accessory factor
MLFSEAQYNRRDELNARGSIYETVPAPFDETAEICWTPVWSLTAREFRYVPTEYCYAYFQDLVRPSKRYCLADSNGNAAGNTMEEAILQGFLELVERDAVALWWYGRIPRPAVKLDSIDNRYVDALRQEYRKLGREVWVLDLTNDLEVPTFAAVSRRIDKAEEEIVWGFGSHFDATLGLLRALSEVSQHIPRPRSDDRPYETSADSRLEIWYRTGRVSDHAYLGPDQAMPRHLADYSANWSDDLAENVMQCQKIVERKGMEMLVLDQTRAEVGLPVVKVIVPGLRHFRPRFAPGRLYEVPRSLGWIDQPLTEDGLNPMPYCFP